MKTNLLLVAFLCATSPSIGANKTRGGREVLATESVATRSVLELLVPASGDIKNEECRRHSEKYLEELRNFKLWAAQMFDATTKFPSGILVGSTYGMGNFDECINTRVEFGSGDRFSGKYCLANVKIEPPEKGSFSSDLDSDVGDAFLNVSAWERILTLSKDRSKRQRNEIHWAFCIPSSCSHEDLKTHLKRFTAAFGEIQGFQISVDVKEENCRVDEPFTLTTADITFVSIICIFLLFILGATIYDLASDTEGARTIKLSKKKHEIILAFSAWRNMNKLVLHSTNPDGLDCINGLKVISMFFIIMGHRLMFSIGSPLLNVDYIESFYSKIEAMVLLNGPIIVDSFFNISGFLACYLLLCEYEKGKDRNYISLILHRMIRIIPAYAVVLALYATILVKLGSGPLWNEKVALEQDRCISSWWTNLLFINNYINSDKICMFQSWYITCDMHFFLLTPPIVWLFRKKPKLGIIAVSALILGTITSTFIITYLKEFDAILLLYSRLLKDPISDETFRNIYIPSHTRASPYFVGMLTGYIKYKIKRDGHKFSNKFIYIAWIICVIMMEATVYSAYFFYIPKNYDVYASAIYGAFHHFLWSVCISWFILALSTGNGSWIEPLFSWKGLVPLSRLTYAAFLCHGGLQLYSVATLRQPNYASIFNLLLFTLGDITLAFSAGLILCLMFESPIIGLEKILRR